MLDHPDDGDGDDVFGLGGQNAFVFAALVGAVGCVVFAATSFGTWVLAQLLLPLFPPVPR